MNTMIEHQTPQNTLLSFPDAIRELKAVATREQIRWVIGDTGANPAPVVQVQKVGRYKLFTRQQVETIRQHFEGKRS